MSDTEFKTYIDKTLVRRHFDRRAAEYDRYAAVQAEMAAALVRFAEEAGAPARPSRILEIGCGTGRLTRRLLERFPQARVTALDLSPAMVARTRDRLGEDQARVRLVTADAEEWAAAAAEAAADPNLYDLIFSNAAFQWFNEPEVTVPAYLDMMVAPGGALAFSTFGPRTFHELHGSFRAAEVELGLPRTAHGQTFPASAFWSSICQGDKWNIHLRTEERVVHFSTVSEFLTSVQRVGAGNAGRPDGGPPGGKRLFAHMRDHYDSQYRDAEGIRATYEIFYGVYTRR